MRKRLNGIIKRLLLVLVILAVFAILLAVYLFVSVRVDDPVTEYVPVLSEQPVKISDNHYRLRNSFIRKNRYGLWEMAIHGEPFERGVMEGKLSSELIRLQEQYFVEKLGEMIPSKSYINFLRIFVGWFNRNLDDYIIDEYKKEIYGVSLSASDEYDYIGSKFQRILNYHAAHDIGHALQNMHLVGCTAFSVRGGKTWDGKIISGRNFDFYMGDEFSRDKIILFVFPDSGYKYVSVTWGGMTGVLSGMNEHGLTVSINAAENSLPLSSAVPVSLIAREILQYSSNIEEAFQIALKRKSFVSESILINSASDRRSVVIEKSPDRTEIFETAGEVLVSTNHFQKMRLEETEESSAYRYARVNELISASEKIDALCAAKILRDRKGSGGRDIGLGNEKSVNQLIAHHSVIFEPERLLFWVSSPPFQCGEYLGYDLNKIFNSGNESDENLIEVCRTIKEDPFVSSDEYTRYKKYKTMKGRINAASRSSDDLVVPDSEINEMISLNPESYLAYQTAGDYMFSRKRYRDASGFYAEALSKEIARKAEKERINEMIEKCANED